MLLTFMYQSCLGIGKYSREEIIQSLSICRPVHKREISDKLIFELLWLSLITISNFCREKSFRNIFRNSSLLSAILSSNSQTQNISSNFFRPFITSGLHQMKPPQTLSVPRGVASLHFEATISREKKGKKNRQTVELAGIFSFKLQTKRK